MQFKEAFNRLHEIQFRFDNTTSKEKITWIDKLAKTQFRKSEEIIACHERLLCILAFPDNQKVFDAATNALKQLGEKTKMFLENAGDS